MLGIIVLYFLLTFIVFGFHDYSQSYRRLRGDIIERISKGTVSSKHEAEQLLRDLRGELEDLANHPPWSVYARPAEEATKHKSRVQELRKEIEKSEQLSKFFDYYKGSFFERLRLRGLRTFFDLFLPIFVGLYVVILLFFFTKIPAVNDTIPKSGQEVTISEKVDSNDVTQVTQVE